MKKFLEMLFYSFMTLLALLCIVVIICSLNPDLSGKLGNFLYGNNADAAEVILPAQTQEESMTPSVQEPEELATQQDGQMQEVPAAEAEDIVMPAGVQTYQVPEIENLEVPDNVTGLTGYEPVSDNPEQVGEQEQRELPQQLGYGQTGDGLTFDATRYPYYAMLSEKLQSVYRQIYANALALNDEFALVEKVNASQLKNAFTAVVADHPELFWVDTAFSSKYGPDGNCVAMKLQFNQTADNLDASRNEFENRANAIVAGAQGLGSTSEKEQYVHDALLDQTQYHLNAPMNQSAYSALVNGQTVCAGYARAFQYMMQQLGVPCYYCMGFAGENHAWNIIGMDGEFYNVDCTWDDAEPNTYDYYNKSDNDFNQNHVRRDLSVYLPACNGESYQLQAPQTQIQEIPVTSNLRSLVDTGFDSSQVFNSLDDYYADCYNQVVANGAGDYQFQSVIGDMDMFSQIADDYETGAFRQRFAQAALDALQEDYCYVVVDAETLQEGNLLLTHHISVR